jgi:hypothetical protein
MRAHSTAVKVCTQRKPWPLSAHLNGQELPLGHQGVQSEKPLAAECIPQQPRASSQLWTVYTLAIESVYPQRLRETTLAVVWCGGLLVY